MRGGRRRERARSGQGCECGAGRAQGPFSRGDILDWYEGRYFPSSLPIRPAGTRDAPFKQLAALLPAWTGQAAPAPPPAAQPAPEPAGAAPAAGAPDAAAPSGGQPAGGAVRSYGGDGPGQPGGPAAADGVGWDARERLPEPAPDRFASALAGGSATAGPGGAGYSFGHHFAPAPAQALGGFGSGFDPPAPAQRPPQQLALPGGFADFDGGDGRPGPGPGHAGALGHFPGAGFGQGGGHLGGAFGGGHGAELHPYAHLLAGRHGGLGLGGDAGGHPQHRLHPQVRVSPACAALPAQRRPRRLLSGLPAGPPRARRSCIRAACASAERRRLWRRRHSPLHGLRMSCLLPRCRALPPTIARVVDSFAACCGGRVVLRRAGAESGRPAPWRRQCAYCLHRVCLTAL